MSLGGGVTPASMLMWRYNHGGLMRCCIGTLYEHNAPGKKEDEVLSCKHCSSSMIWKWDCWEWNRKGEYSGQQTIDDGGS